MEHGVKGRIKAQCREGTRKSKWNKTRDEGDRRKATGRFASLRLGDVCRQQCI